MNPSRPLRHWLGLVSVALLAALVLGLAYSFLLAHPDEYFMQPGGDGLQAYFATAYYALYDTGSRFSGMNYPYGENFTYPNLQPAVAWTMGVLQRAGLPTAIHTVGITNLLALLGVWLTPLVMYAILRRLRLPVVYSVLLALLITFLAPQIQRLGDHMSLSYPCFVPWLWYCILRMLDEPRRWRWYIIFGASSLLMGYVMAYFLACGSFFLLAHVLLLAFRRRGYTWGQLGAMVVAALLPLLLFRTWLWLTDSTTDRPPNPYGFLVYITSWQGLFTPSLPPIRPLWTGLFSTKDVEFEGMSYVGLVGTGVLIATFIRFVSNLIRRRGRPVPIRRYAPAPLALSLWAAGLLVLFAGGVPFIFPPLNKLVPYLGPLRQFRALGRFAWPFYFVYTTYVAYYLHGLWRLQRQRRIALGALPWVPLLLLLWAGEAWANLSTRVQIAQGGAGARAYMRPPHPLLQELSWANRRPADFQAIMPLPYFNLGSDKFLLEGSAQSIREIHRLALASGLPELSSYVSRPSIGQVMRHVQLLSSPLLDKTLLRDFPNQKPLLLLVTPQSLTLAEQRLVSLAKLLVSTPEVQLYELPLAALAATTRAEEQQRAAALLPTLPQRPGGLRATTPKGVIMDDFAKRPDRRGHLAPGALADHGEARIVMYNGPVPAPADTGRYEVSVWVNGHTDFGYGSLQVRQYDAGGGELDYQYKDGRICTEIDGDWIRVAVTVRIRPETKRLEVLYANEDLLVDDLLIRPEDTNVYWTSPDQQLILNGYRLGPAGALAR
ncbi:hypothetical protein EJV47_19495 [Hymenobacter gummosus]|uniref:DUF6311 domain-containing protein n=1 Tax=Hymenobacter gummosus TaxID=1776032 RepID=A0A431TZ29_9BACT|nr:hypothetical protein [Hymenobacter gummosus]RTQ47600.1 hypothetical protein EJV47_19495 [Hymenobacter gummosus]